MVGSFGAQETLGQSFLIRRQPLTGIQLWLRDAEPGVQSSGVVTFTLATTDEPGTSIYSGQFSFQQIANSFPISVKFPEISLEVGKQYQVTLSTDSGQIQAYGKSEDFYPNGNALKSSSSLAGDLAFRLEYAYTLAAMGEDLQTLLSLMGPILIMIAVLIIPGWMLMSWLSSNRKMETVSQIGIIIGLSLAIIPIVFYWTSLAGFRWNHAAVLLSFILAGVFIAFTEVRHQKLTGRDRLDEDQDFEKTGTPKNSWRFGVLILLLFGGALFIRIAMVRDLSAPAWVDPVHHTLINRMIVEDGKLPNSFLPYADAPVENYHTGYHSTSAVVTWLTGLNYLETQFVFGQVLNAACILAIYLFTYTLTGSRLASLAAALITGFITPMPAYYTSWGRYTQLAGLMILPAAFGIIRRLYIHDTQPARSISSSEKILSPEIWKTIFLASILLAGTFFVHIRVTVFLVCLILVDLVIELLQHWKNYRVFGRIAGTRLLIVGAVSIALAAPLFFRILGQVFPQRVTEWNTGNPGDFSLAWQFLTAGSGRFSLILAALGLLVALYLRPRFVTLLVTWVAMMFFLVYLPQIGFPLNGIVSSDSVMITLFIPISAAGGFFIYALHRFFHQSGIRAANLAGDFMLILLAGLCIIFGSRSIIPIINPVTVYFKTPDHVAAEWITENLPAEAAFLINPAPWGYGMYVGSDGGYWLSPLTGRITFPPTLLYAHGSADIYTVINQQVRKVISSANDPLALNQVMDELELDYLYLGAQGGLFSPDMLLQSPLFELIYHEGGVWIFRQQAHNQMID